MKNVSLSTERLRYLLKQFDEKEFDYRICSAKDVLGPGGGVYITGDAPLTEQHLNWLERRSLTPDAPTFVDVVFVKGTVPAKAPDDEIDGDLARRHSERQRRAEASSREVAKNAQEVAKQAEKVFHAVGKMDVSVAALKKGEQLGLREFELRFKAFQKSVQEASKNT